MRVAVIGAGSWGTTVASLAAENADTMIWCRREEVAASINAQHKNSFYLSDYDLNPALAATSDLQMAVEQAELVIMGVPSHGFREILMQMAGYMHSDTPVYSLTKGLEQGTRLRMTQVIAEVLPGHDCGVLTGPNIAREVLEGHAAASVSVSTNAELAALVQQIMSTAGFRVYTNTDVVGSELGGALKNVIAIAAGMSEGLGTGDNTRATVITRGLAELVRLGQAMGGRPETLSGLAGMGDLIVTSISRLSRNRFVGEQLGKGKKLSDTTEGMDQVAEGVRTTAVVMELAEECAVEMPISRAVNSVISGACTPEQAYEDLLKREARPELDF